VGADDLGRRSTEGNLSGVDAQMRRAARRLDRDTVAACWLKIVLK